MLYDLLQIKTGPQLQRALHDSGLHHAKITRDRITGQFITRFYEKILPGYVEPAEHWIPKLENIIPDATVIAAQNVRATWQPGEPVITATIWLELPQVSEKDLLILGFVALANQMIAFFEEFISNLLWLSLEIRRALFRQWLNRRLNTPLLPAPQIAGYLPAPKSATPIADTIEKFGTAPVVAAMAHMANLAGQEAEKAYWEKYPPRPELTFAQMREAYPMPERVFKFDC
jgi:hypothetical protein